MRRAPLLALAALCLAPLATGCTSPGLAAPPGLVALENRLEQGEDDYELRWQLSSGCLDVVDAHPGAADRDRLAYARKALEYARSAIEQDEEGVEGHFYCAIALGRVLEFEFLPDLDQIGELESEAERARELDSTYEHGGPLRFLALLYMNAPPWPIGPELAGEEEEIEALWEEALLLASGWVENHLGFAEFLAEEERDAEALAHARQAKALLATAEPLLPAAREDMRRRIQALLDSLSS
ncbi:MAG: hypothetical protein JKY65_08455 [Planctomycetes bacterium]|nr:hypothetical protein [Planctomycetota bacterium]